jgi:hypothetical protein
MDRLMRDDVPADQPVSLSRLDGDAAIDIELARWKAAQSRR